MTKQWLKYIKKHPLKIEILKTIEDIANNNLDNYEIKKLKGYKDLFRIRKGKIRIIFRKSSNGNEILAVDTRGDIYKSF